MRDPILVIHFAAGAAAVLAGPIALVALFRGEARGSRMLGYQVALGVVNATAVALVLFDLQDLWFLAVIAVAVEAAGLAGWALGRHGASAKPGTVARLLGGTYVGLITAILVVSWDSPLAWILPTLVAVPLIERAAAAVNRSDAVRRRAHGAATPRPGVAGGGRSTPGPARAPARAARR